MFIPPSLSSSVATRFFREYLAGQLCEFGTEPGFITDEGPGGKEWPTWRLYNPECQLQDMLSPRLRQRCPGDNCGLPNVSIMFYGSSVESNLVNHTCLEAKQHDAYAMYEANDQDPHCRGNRNCFCHVSNLYLVNKGLAGYLLLLSVSARKSPLMWVPRQYCPYSTHPTGPYFGSKRLDVIEPPSNKPEGRMKKVTPYPQRMVQFSPHSGQ